MKGLDWKQKYRDKIGTAQAAVKLIQPGNTIFLGTGCSQPQHLIDALIDHSGHIHDAHIVRLLTMGAAPHVDKRLREKFKMNSFFIADNRRDVMERTIGDYTPIFVSEMPTMSAMHCQKASGITHRCFSRRYLASSRRDGFLWMLR